MPIDDHPLDALTKQFQMEDLTISPANKVIAKILASMPLEWPLDKLADVINEHIAVDSLERIKLVLEILSDELKKTQQAVKILELTTRQQISELILDAARRAEVTRSKERVKRIGTILANSIIETESISPDESEEMMRVAMELSDRDIKFLRELIRIEGAQLKTQNHISRPDAHTIWEKGWWGTSINPEIDSVFSKLESYGLVSRLAPPNNLNIYADYQNRYVLLKKGSLFADLIQTST